MRSARSCGSKLAFVKKSRSSETRCPSLRARAVPPYGTKCFGVAFNSFQTARCDEGRMLSLGEKIIGLPNWLQFAPSLVNRPINILLLSFPTSFVRKITRSDRVARLALRDPVGQSVEGVGEPYARCGRRRRLASRGSPRCF